MNFTVKSQKCALIKAMLDGHTLDILNGMKMIGATNIPREVGRHIINPESGFAAYVTKTRIDITTQYGTSGYYFTYKLERSERNKGPIELMKKYLSEQEIKPKKPVPEKPKKETPTITYQRPDLFSNL